MTAPADSLAADSGSGSSARFAEEDALLRIVEEAQGALAQARAEIGRRVIGQERVVDLTLAAILSGGHALLVGAPGLAKTLLVETFGVVLGVDARRIQFTPDLMPSDILGAEVLAQGADGSRAFRFVKGPIFAQLLMADEINRASPRTQSALLQAMQEKHVTIAGERHDLPAPFHVLATRNPIEQEGAYPLPEAQLDRFLFEIDVDYPDRDAERAILLATTGAESVTPHAAITAEQLQRFQGLVRRIPVGEKVTEAILTLVRCCRPGDPQALESARRHVAWGPGPRAAQALMLTVRAKALLEGRFAPDLQDVADLAIPALRHRMAPSFAARAEGVSLDGVIAEALAKAGALPKAGA